jgi:hypothetical protein
MAFGGLFVPASLPRVLVWLAALTAEQWGQLCTAYARGQADRLVGPDSVEEYAALQQTVDLPRLLEIEARTMEGR